MAKVFRLHTGASNTISNWGQSVKLGSMAIDTISDPIGANDSKEITSIPSPFARIDLVKNAFKIVANGDLDGNTIYHKLVSDSLDVGQIFFNIEKYRNVIEIIVWDKKNDLANLNNDYVEEHKRLGKTLSTFLIEDSAAYNFEKMNCIYLLNYKPGPNPMNIIGATSPATLFFTSANNLSYVGNGNGNGKDAIKFGNDSPFDGSYLPLYKRDDSYIKYWWSLKVGFPNFAALFPEVNEYLVKSYTRLSSELKAELQQISNSTYQSEYDDITVRPTAQNYVSVLGQKLKRKRISTTVDSGFKMVVSSSLRKPGMKAPLVLPVETYTEQTKYVIDVWNKNTCVPYYDNTPIQNRILPDDGTQYPYVTVGDFLEDSIIKVPYKLNSSNFFNGNDDQPDSNDSYLLPLRKTFFDYFQVSDLIGKVGAQKMIEMVRLAGDAGVKVILRIPVKAGCIQYQRIYYKGDTFDRKLNKGVIVEREFTIGVFPAIKYPDLVTPFYRVSILDRDSLSSRNNVYALKFYNSSNAEVSVDMCVERNKNSNGDRFNGDAIDSATYSLSHQYQYIAVSDDSAQPLNAIVVPKLVTKTGNRKFRFAIDFGTTNTHIEYSVDGGISKPFDITENDRQIQKLHLVDTEFFLQGVFNSDFIPDTVGGESAYKYPMRTVLAESNNTNWARIVYAMAHTNIPYTYEKDIPLSYNVLHTDLKWSTNPDDKMRASKYIESILVMLRNKVLLNNGDLSSTEIVWFYPASMTQSRFNKFKSEWEQAFQKYFNAPEKNIVTISESVAPYYYHKSKKGATSTVVSIDVGGGTTDVLFVDKGEPKYLTSFRFAANTIFGDGYSYDSDSNGFVKEYYPKILHLLAENDLTVLKDVLKSLKDKKVSTDTIAFFFSLASNKDVLKHVNIDFNKMLADDQKGKYVVILFYVAVIYHIANIMKCKGFAMPRHITFSGNGSKILNILSTNNKTLEEFTKLIFEKIYGEKYSIDGLTIIRPENSKESTCKGGIELSPFQSQDYSQIRGMKTILLGNNDIDFAKADMSYDSIDSDMLDGVVKNVQAFIDFAFGLNKEFSFYNQFDVDRSLLEKTREICRKDIRTYLDNGLSIRKEAITHDGGEEHVEESLFFYPLIGILNAISREIYNLS